MKIEEKKAYNLITFFDSFDLEIQEFDFFYNKKAEKSIILQLSNNEIIEEKNIFVLLSYVRKHIERKMSFIIVLPIVVDIDKFPENLNIVTTIREAEDVIEIENIERELGF